MTLSSYLSYNHPPSSPPSFEQSNIQRDQDQRDKEVFTSSPIEFTSSHHHLNEQEQIRTWEEDQAEIKRHFEQRERDRLAGKDQEEYSYDPFDRFDEMADDRQRISHYTTNDPSGFPQQLYSFAALRLEADGQVARQGGYADQSSAFIAPPSEISQGITSPATSPYVGFGTSPTTTSPASFSSHLPSSPVQFQTLNSHLGSTANLAHAYPIPNFALTSAAIPQSADNIGSNMMIRHASQPVLRDPNQDWHMAQENHYTSGMPMQMPMPDTQLYSSSMNVPFPNQIQVPVLPPSTPAKKTRTIQEKSHARKRPDGYVKRPQNSFILYRTHVTKNNLIPEQYQINRSQDKSRIIGMMWKSLTPEERKPWEDLSRETHEEHLKMFPSYRYKPESNKKDKSKRNLNTPDDIEKTCEAIANSILKSQGRHAPANAKSSRRKAKKKSKADMEKEKLAGPSASSSRRAIPKATKKLRSSVRSGRKSDSSDKAVTGEKSAKTNSRTRRGGKGKEKESDSDESEEGAPTLMPIFNAPNDDLYHQGQDKEQDYHPPNLDLTTRRRSSSMPTGMQSNHLKPFFPASSLGATSHDVQRSLPASAYPTFLPHVEEDPIAAAAVAAVTSDAHLSDASVELFASWQDRIAQAAHQAAETNIYANSSLFDAQFNGMPSARSFSADNALSSAMGHHFAYDASGQHQTRSEHEDDVHFEQAHDNEHARPHTTSACSTLAMTVAKKRPERLALARSNLDALPSMSPRTMPGSTLTSMPALTPRHNSDFSANTTQSALARQTNTEPIAQTGFQSTHERPHTSYALRNGEDSMLISPTNETMEDLRRTSLTGNNWQSFALRRSRLSQFDVALPVMHSRLSIGSGAQSQMATPTGFPPTPLTAKFNPFRFTSGTYLSGMESRRNSLLVEEHSEHQQHHQQQPQH
ncbi:uncharacterized protein FA14DRAFT_93068 [Meira miltonrushii]|uniref:HMG box domain-containing protein n=1 Tax=Meira miltonrushii TaxID=1280837 RepID=A0A316V5L6_9BASI|nr:uncharacterized protein FA14DRAFT_93068 [Meira miltonrushii]PWN31801.1 hypothetical protein FA14DRAFT_93068 [Meira miltonrushii]